MVLGGGVKSRQHTDDLLLKTIDGNQKGKSRLSILERRLRVVKRSMDSCFLTVKRTGWEEASSRETYAVKT